jgi:hypothetical protein
VVELEDVQAQIALREVDETALVRGHVVRLRRDFTGAGCEHRNSTLEYHITDVWITMWSSGCAPGFLRTPANFAT